MSDFASDFPSDFESLFRAPYLAAVRRVRDKRERLSLETVAFLHHLAAAGPMNLTEMARQMDRAASALSEMVDHLFEKGLLTRDRDPHDARRCLIWLTGEGQAALTQAHNVLDHDVLDRAARHISSEDRVHLLRMFET